MGKSSAPFPSRNDANVGVRGGMEQGGGLALTLLHTSPYPYVGTNHSPSLNGIAMNLGGVKTGWECHFSEERD